MLRALPGRPLALPSLSGRHGFGKRQPSHFLGQVSDSIPGTRNLPAPHQRWPVAPASCRAALSKCGEFADKCYMEILPSGKDNILQRPFHFTENEILSHVLEVMLSFLDGAARRQR